MRRSTSASTSGTQTPAPVTSAPAATTPEPAKRRKIAFVPANQLNLENLTLSGTVPEMFAKFRRLEYWNTFGNNLTGHLPPSTQRLGRRAPDNLQFFVQDEQLELRDVRVHRAPPLVELRRNYDFHADAFLEVAPWVHH